MTKEKSPRVLENEEDHRVMIWYPVPRGEKREGGTPLQYSKRGKGLVGLDTTGVVWLTGKRNKNRKESVNLIRNRESCDPLRSIFNQGTRCVFFKSQPIIKVREPLSLRSHQKDP